jgi:hypothetical protein
MLCIVKGTADGINDDRVYVSPQNGTCIYARLLSLFPNAAISEAKEGEQFRKLAVKYAVQRPGMRGM